MLPLDAVISIATGIPFLEPLNSWVYTPLQEKVLGGTAIGDGAAGRMVQNWFVSYATGMITVYPEGGAPQLTLTIPNVKTVSLGFDANMSVAIAYIDDVGANLYYYNTLTSGYSVLTVAGATSCRACVDDPRTFDSGASDVIFSYVLSDVLYYRVQRERYQTAHTIGNAIKQHLIKAGFTTQQCLEFELVGQL